MGMGETRTCSGGARPLWYSLGGTPAFQARQVEEPDPELRLVQVCIPPLPHYAALLHTIEGPVIHYPLLHTGSYAGTVPTYLPTDTWTHIWPSLSQNAMVLLGWKRDNSQRSFLYRVLCRVIVRLLTAINCFIFFSQMASIVHDRLRLRIP